MKKILLFTFAFACAGISFSQNQNANSSAVWNLNGNTINGSASLGTNNASDLLFKTNNLLRGRLSAQGHLLLEGGTKLGVNLPLAAGFIPQFMLDVNGDGRITGPFNIERHLFVQDYIKTLTEFHGRSIHVDTIHMGPGKLIHGDGEWNGNLVVRKDLNVMEAANFTGDVTMNSNLKLNNLPIKSKSGALLLLDANGTVSRTPVFTGPIDIGILLSHDDNSCDESASFWTQGGNNLGGYSLDYHTIGTCDNEDFILKTNDVARIFLHKSGKVGIGIDPNTLLTTNIETSNLNVKSSMNLGYEATNGGNNFVKIGHNGSAAFIDIYPNNGAKKDLLLGYFTPMDVVIGQQGVNPGNLFVAGQVKVGDKWYHNVHNDAQLMVYGKLLCTSAYVMTNNWPDYVFADDYKLMPLKKVEEYYKQNKRLPEVMSEKEVLENGINVGEMNKILMKKIEELTLYIVELEKKIEGKEELNKKIENLTSIISIIEKRMMELEKK